MKKALALVLVLTMMFAIVACGQSAKQRQFTEFELQTKELATRMLISANTMMNVEEYERDFIDEYKTLYGKDPDAKSIIYGTKIYYDGLGNSWTDMVTKYQSIVVDYEALQKAPEYSSSENASVVSPLRVIYKNYLLIHDYVINRRGTSSEYLDAIGNLLNSAKELNELLPDE